MSGTTVAIGVPRDDNANGDNAGAVYIFEESSPGNWTETAKILADDGEVSGKFGTAFAIDGDLLAVGAPNHDSPIAGDAGVIHLYERGSGTTWTKVLDGGATAA